MTNRRKYQGDELELKLLEVSDDPASLQKPKKTIVTAQQEVPIPVVEASKKPRTLH